MIYYFHDIGIICLAQLYQVHFIISTVDNIDHNLTSEALTGSFHGTSLTLFQNPSLQDVMSGEDSDEASQIQ